MPLETECDFSLAFPAKANHFIEVLIRLHIPTILSRREAHLVPFCKTVLASIWFMRLRSRSRASHPVHRIAPYCLLFFEARWFTMAASPRFITR